MRTLKWIGAVTRKTRNSVKSVQLAETLRKAGYDGLGAFVT